LVGWDVSDGWRSKKLDVTASISECGEVKTPRLQSVGSWFSRYSGANTSQQSRSMLRTTRASWSRKRGSSSSSTAKMSAIRASFVSGSASTRSNWRRRSSALPSRLSGCKGCVTKPPASVGERRGRRAVSFLRGRTRERNMRMLRGLAAVESHTGRPSSQVSTLAADRTISGYEIPSYYLGEFKRQSAILSEHDRLGWGTLSSGIPSYYFKEHDEDGRSILSEVVKRPSFEKGELELTSIGKDDTEKVNYTGDIVTRTLTGGTAVNQDGEKRRRRSGFSDEIVGATGGPAGQASRNGDGGWDSVYCSGWKSTDD
jgi:hypothetical protein